MRRPPAMTVLAQVWRVLVALAQDTTPTSLPIVVATRITSKVISAALVFLGMEVTTLELVHLNVGCLKVDCPRAA